MNTYGHHNNLIISTNGFLHIDFCRILLSTDKNGRDVILFLSLNNIFPPRQTLQMVVIWCEIVYVIKAQLWWASLLLLKGEVFKNLPNSCIFPSAILFELIFPHSILQVVKCTFTKYELYIIKKTMEQYTSFEVLKHLALRFNYVFTNKSYVSWNLVIFKSCCWKLLLITTTLKGSFKICVSHVINDSF